MKVTSNKFVRADPYLADSCDYQSIVKTPEKYKTQSFETDMILLFSVVNETSHNYLAYASYCSLGSEFIIQDF